MTLFRAQNTVLLYVHIPKTGGTSINDALLKSGFARAMHHGTRFSGFSKTTFQHLHAEILTKVAPAGFFDFAFCTVRNPFTRFVSEYRYRAKRGLHKKSFEKFSANALKAHGKDACTMDNHIRPQVDFLVPDVKVFRLEDGLNPVFDFIEDSTGIAIKGKSTHSNRAGRDPVTVTRSTLERITELYQEDFDAFSYDPKAIPPVLEVIDG